MTTLQAAAATTANTLEQIYRMVMNKKGLDPFVMQLIFDAANSLRTALAQQTSDEYKRGFSDGLKEAPTGECWIRAIDEAMVGAHLGVADIGDDYGTAKKKLNDLICWSVDVDRELAQQDDKVTALRSQVEYLEKIVEDQAKVVAQQGQEPFATVTKDAGRMQIEFIGDLPDGETMRLYTAAPAPQAQPVAQPTDHSEQHLDMVAQPLRELSDEEIKAWWASENGLEDMELCRLNDFTQTVRAVLKKARGNERAHTKTMEAPRTCSGGRTRGHQGDF